MTVDEYIDAIKTAPTSQEILTLWTRAAAERHLSVNDIISVHRSCGKVITDAALAIRERDVENLRFQINMK